MSAHIDVIERFITALTNAGYVVRQKVDDERDPLNVLLTISHPDEDGELKLDVWQAS